MRKIDVIIQKEVIAEYDLTGCTAVVIDVFLATSTIAFLLEKNYSSVYAKENIKRAKEFANALQEDVLLLGEVNGHPVDGFVYPDPNIIEKAEKPIPAIFSSTNGTVAIEQSKLAKNLYTSSLVNGHVISRWIHEKNDQSNIVIVCSGNAGGFSLEDFIGAGQVVEHLINQGEYELSDAAKVALDTYQDSKLIQFKNLYEGRTYKLLASKNMEDSVDLILENMEKVNVLPKYESGKIIDLLKQENLV